MINKVPKIPTFILLLVAGIICDAVVKKGITLVYVENWNGFIIAAIQIQGTIVTLAIALLSLLSSIFKEKYFGVRVIDYVLFVDDNNIDLTKLMKYEIIFVILNIILYILGGYNTILFITVNSICIVIYFITRICFIFKPIGEIETCIKSYLEKLFFVRVSLRNNLYQQIKELILDNNDIELKKYLDFVVVLFNRMGIDANRNKIDELFDELADCIQECFASDDFKINILGAKISLETIKLQKILIKSKIKLDKDIFEKMCDMSQIATKQYYYTEEGINLRLFSLPCHSIEIKIEKEKQGETRLRPHIYSYYVSKYIMSIKLYEEEIMKGLSEVFGSYIDMLYHYHEIGFVKNIIVSVNSSILFSLYDKEWSQCYELVFFNNYIARNGWNEYIEENQIVLIQMLYLYINKFFNKLDSENIINNRFKDLYIKYNEQISRSMNSIAERKKTLFTNKNMKLIYDLLVNRVRYFYNNFNVNVVKEFFIILLFIIETDDKVVTEICNNLMAGDYFVIYHHMFDNREITKQKFDYMRSILSERIIYNVSDKELYSKFSRIIDMLYSKHRLEQKKEYYENSIMAISNFENSLNEYIKQYVIDLVKPFDIVDATKESVSIEEEQTLIDLPVEILSDAEYIFGAVKEYIKNHVVKMLGNSIKDYMSIRYEKISEGGVKKYLNSIRNSELLIGNESFQYWELDRIQDDISNKINKTNSIILWTDDDGKYLTKIDLNKLKVTFDDVIVKVKDYTDADMLRNCTIDNGEYIVEMDTGIRVSLTKEKMIEYFKYSRKIVEVKYIFKYQIIDTNDIAEKTIFSIDK